LGKNFKKKPNEILKDFLSQKHRTFWMVLHIFDSNIRAHKYIKKYLYIKKSTIELTPFNGFPMDNQFGYYPCTKRISNDGKGVNQLTIYLNQLTI